MVAGAGCVGLAVLKNVKNSTITFAEKKEKFIKQIKINLELNNIAKQRYKVIQSDIFDNIKEKYDYILANPPYVDMTGEIQKSVLDFEPRGAIAGGKNGLLYIEKFLKNARQFLKKNGGFYLEFGPYQRKSIEKLLKKYNYKHYQFHKDQYKQWRYITCKP